MNYENQIIETQTLLEGYTFVSSEFLETLRNQYAFKGNEKFANANIYGRVTIYQPNTIDNHICHFAIEKKIIDGKEFFRAWFAPVDFQPEFSITMQDIVKAWCGIRNVSLDCLITQRILNSLETKKELAA